MDPVIASSSAAMASIDASPVELGPPAGAPGAPAQAAVSAMIEKAPRARVKPIGVLNVAFVARVAGRASRGALLVGMFLSGSSAGTAKGGFIRAARASLLAQQKLRPEVVRPKTSSAVRSGTVVYV